MVNIDTGSRWLELKLLLPNVSIVEVRTDLVIEFVGL